MSYKFNSDEKMVDALKRSYTAVNYQKSCIAAAEKEAATELLNGGYPYKLTRFIAYARMTLFEMEKMQDALKQSLSTEAKVLWEEACANFTNEGL